MNTPQEALSILDEIEYSRDGFVKRYPDEDKYEAALTVLKNFFKARQATVDAAFAKEMEGRQYGEEETRDAKAWFTAGYEGRCDMGVGCEEAGVCYASAQGEPERCGRPTAKTEDDGSVEYARGRGYAWLDERDRRVLGSVTAVMTDDIIVSTTPRRDVAPVAWIDPNDLPLLTQHAQRITACGQKVSRYTLGLVPVRPALDGAK